MVDSIDSGPEGTRQGGQGPVGIREGREEVRSPLDARDESREATGSASESEVDPGDELGHPHAQRGRVAKVRRRRSPIDPPDGSWAVIGTGTGSGVQHSTVLGALAGVHIPVVGYEANHGDENGSDQLIRFDHIVISVDEIDDIEGLAVTSWDRVTGEINTDYFAGVVVATRDTRFCGDLIDSTDFPPSPVHRLFTPHHPAVVLLAPSAVETDAVPVSRADAEPEPLVDVAPGSRVGVEPVTEPEAEAVRVSRTDTAPIIRSQADFVAEYARLLADSPRLALSLHRRICAGTDVSVAAKGSAPIVGEHDSITSLQRLLREIADPDQAPGAKVPT